MFASQERPKIVASKMLPARIDTLECFTPLWKSTKTSIFSYFSPNLPNKWLISCNHFIQWTLFLEMKQNENFHIYSILWKCQQVWFLSRRDISPNKSLGTPVKRVLILYTSSVPPPTLWFCRKWWAMKANSNRALRSCQNVFIMLLIPNIYFWKIRETFFLSPALV